MRTTLNIDDEVFRALKSYATAHGCSLSSAAPGILRPELNVPVRTRKVNGILTFVLPPDTSKVTTERVKQLLEDEF
jgi:hypothetical protein